MALTRPRLGQLNTGVASLGDPITVLHAGATSANVDVGFLMNRANGLVSNVALYWNETGNTFVTSFTANTGGTDSNVTPTSYANITTGNLLPGANVTYNLGSPTQRWKDLWLSTSTIYLGNGTISAPNGAITITNDAGGSFSVTGSAAGQASGSFGNLIANSGITSTGISTGALQIVGGAGISGNVFIGGNLDVTGTVTFRNTVVETSTELVQGVEIVAGNLVANSGTASTNTTSGALVVAGGAGVSGSIYAGGLGAFTSGVKTNSITSSSASVALYTDGTQTTIGIGSSGTTTTVAGSLVTPQLYVTTLTGGTINAATIGNTGATLTGTLSTAAQPNITSLGTLTGLTTSGNTIVNSTLYGQTVYDRSNRVLTSVTISPGTGMSGGGTITGPSGTVTLTNTGVTGLSSSGAGNVTVSAATGTITVALSETGPGAINVGSSTAIPTIVTDAYGRIVSLTSNAVSTTINTTGTTGSGSVSGGGTLSFSSTNGIVVAASGSTISISSPQDLRSTATPTFAGVITNGNTVINSTAYINGVTNITNNTNSSGAGNGALVVTGGIGASGTVNFGSDLYVTGNIYTANLVATTTSTLNTASPMVYFNATPYPYNFETGFYSHFIGGSANVYAHTGMVRNHNNNYWTFFSNVKSEPSSTTINFADAGIVYDTIYAGGAIIANATASTGTTTGALVVEGGVGITGNLNVNSAGYFGYNAAATSLVNPSIIGTSSSQAVNAGQYYVQMALINNAGTGSSDITAYPNNVTDGSSGFMDLGVTGNLYADPSYTITKANDGYLFASAKDGALLGGNLVLATDRTGTYNDIVIAVGSFYSNAEVARFHGNTSNGGYLQLSQGTSSTSTSTGALLVNGGVGISGNIYSDKLYVTNGIYWAANNNVISSGGGGSAPAGVSGQMQFNSGGVLGASPLYYWSSNTSFTTSVAVTSTTSITASTLTSTVATGTAPFTVSSTTAVTNLNADLWDGNHFSDYLNQAVKTTSSPSFNQVTSTVTTGTAPFVVTSTTAVTNLNADLWDGYHFSDYLSQAVKTTSSPTFAGGNFTGNVTRNSRAIVTNYSGNVAPATPIMGDEWFRGNTGVMYKYLYDNVSNTYNWIDMTSALYNSSTSAVANTLALRDSGANLTASNFIGVASSAKYADLAEIYSADDLYGPGTVVVFGGEQEVTTTTRSHDTRVAGVVSTNPAYLMNSEATGVAVAFTGRVPCLVRGPITKGDLVVSSSIPGVAQRIDNSLYQPGCVIGKSLGIVDTNEIATIEVVVGRF